MVKNKSVKNCKTCGRKLVRVDLGIPTFHSLASDAEITGNVDFHYCRVCDTTKKSVQQRRQK